MINRPKNWDSVQAFTERRKLPLGAYICKIRNAVVKETDYGAQLCILFDISDGEYAGFYADDFAANPQQDKKWKGVLRQFLPKDDGSQKDEWTKSSFKGLTESIEASNCGYSWNWDERSLSGKEIGIIFRNEEWDYNGKTGWTVRPYRACPVGAVIDGDYVVPEDKPLKNKNSGFGSFSAPAPAPGYGSAPVMDFAPIDEDDEDLLF